MADARGPERERLPLEDQLHDLGRALDALTEEEWETWIARYEDRYPDDEEADRG